MNSSSGDNTSQDSPDDNKKLQSNFQDSESGSKSNCNENKDRLNTETKSVIDIPEFSSGTVADRIVHHYDEISKRKTQRMARPALFFTNKPDGESGSQSSGAVNRTLSVTYPSDTIGSVSVDQSFENSGLEKYNRYMKVHRPSTNQTTGDGFQNIEFRRIVGQEDSSNEINNLGKLVHRSDNERKFTSRPPVVGQASSSSNDSGSFALVHHSVSPESITNSCDEASVSRHKDDNVNASAYFENFNSNRSHKHIGRVSNRDDYISEKPLEGSSEQENAFPQPDLQAELPRVPSPSSASSVASVSVRPLEWDSGADVGYFQTYPQNNSDVESKLSTIERIALARGSAALLTRSDPEGTTEKCCQLASRNISSKTLKKNMMRDGVGAPAAESTPFSANILITPHTGGSDFFEIEDISPIVESNFNIHYNNNNYKSNEIINSNDLCNSRSNNDAHLRLFPELQSQKENSPRDVGVCNDHVNNEALLRHADKTSSIPKKDQDGKLWSLNRYYSAPVNNYNDTELDEGDQLSDGPNKLKKISSSMEFLHLKSSFNDKDPSYTLPRSHSHSNILSEMHNDNVNSLPKSLILRGFIPIKSASSSSVSTVVQKKKESPKVISKLVQTSFVQQSVATQASSGEMAHYQNISSNNKALDSLKKSSAGNLCDSNSEKSSYFGFLSGNVGSRDKLFSRHIHNGTPCSGAHKKNVSSGYIADSQKIEFVGNEALICRGLDGGIEFDNCSEVVSDFQNPGDNCNTLESIESSARSGRNNWTSRRESMGVEDRVNSFEYLPGHVFENTAREGNDSHGTGTSSVSLNNNESSRNEYSDGTDKLWDTSASSTLVRDIERGVNLMSDFVKSSNVGDVHLKQKLMKKVVEKLLRTEYPEDKLWIENLVTGSQWLPSQLHNVAEVCNGRETRRSHNKDVQLHASSRSEKSSSRTSSECFQPKNVLSKESKPNVQETAEKCIGTDLSVTHVNEFNHVKKHLPVQSSSSDVITESGSSNVKPKSTVYESSQSQDINQSQFLKSPRGYIQHSVGHIKDSTNSSSNANTTDRSGSVDCSENWRVPASKAEKLYEEKLKRQEKLLTDHGRNRKTSAVLLQYLNIERENQLFWIKSEIQHLSNLKRLLEKQEELKKHMSRMRKPKAHSVLTAVNYKAKKIPRSSSLSEKSSYRSSESEVQVPKTSQDLSCEAPQESSDWSSHHYFNSSHDNIKSFPKDKKKKLNKIQSSDVKENKSENINLLQNVLQRKLSKLSLLSSTSKADVSRKKTLGKGEKNNYPTSLNNCGDDDDEEEDELKVRSRKTVSTETTDTVGIQTSKSVQQLPLIKPEWFKNHKKSMKKESFCKCKKSSFCKNCKKNENNEENNRQSVAYYITFDESPQQNGAESKGKNSKEKQISRHMNESKRHRSVKSKMDSKENNNSTSSSQLSDQKENNEPNTEVTTNHQRLTLQGYLIKNRSDYVSRAEYRRRCVAELAYLRELRDKSKRHLITMAPESSDYSQSSTPRDLPPPPLAVKRVFSQKTMRRQTERKYRQLAEVRNHQLDMKRKEAYRTNRLMAEVFTKKLQRRTLKGEVNLSNSVSVISNI